MSFDTKNSLWLGSQYSLSIIISLVTLKLNLMQFGADLFGIWILLMSIWMFGSSVDLGLGTAMIKFVAEGESNKDKFKLQQILSTSLMMFIVLGIILVLIGYFLGSYFYLKNEKLISPKFVGTANIVFIFLAAQFYFRYLNIFYRSFYEGLNHFVLVSKIGVLNILLIFLSVLITIFFNLKLEWLAFFYFLSSLITLIVMMVIKYWKFDEYKINLLSINIRLVPSMLKFSFAIQGASIFSALFDPVIKYLIGTFYYESAISFYEVSKRFSFAISGLFYSSFRNILPKTSILSTQQSKYNFFISEGYNLVKIGVTYSALMFGSLSFLFIGIIKFFYGYNESVIIFIILSLPEAINNFGYTLYIYLIGVGKAILLVLIQITNLIFVVIGVSIGFLIFKNFYGLMGYFLSVVIANLLMIFVVKKDASFSLKEFIIKTNSNKLILLIASILLLLYLFSVIPLNYSMYLILGYSSIITLIFYPQYYLIIGKLNKIFWLRK